jgi:crotonobetainyl-CoA:carnitine CoA-transferase CaiB-like acyl-CoA transferase
VLSVGHTLPGLYCLACLRDLGAEVIRIQRPAAGGPGAAYAGTAREFPLRSLAAGTHSLGLDLKRAAGRDLFLRLAEGARVVLEGFRPGVAARLGIDFEALSARNPALVYAAVSGYGQEGARRAGHDLNYLAEAGVLGLSEAPGPPGVTFADGLAGLSAALNVVAALAAASRTGAGQFLDLAIVDGPLFLLGAELEHHLRGGESRGAGATHLSGRFPWYGVHQTRDGERVAVGAVEPAFYAALCDGLGLSRWAGLQYPSGPELAASRAAFARAIGSQSLAELLAHFEGKDACLSPLRRVSEVAGSELAGRALREGAKGEKLVRSPVRLPPAPLAPERSGAALLQSLGVAAGEIEGLIRDGIAGE